MREFQPFKKSLSFLSNMLFLQNITCFIFVRIVSENFHKNIAHSIYDKIHSTWYQKYCNKTEFFRLPLGGDMEPGSQGKVVFP